MVTHGTQAVVPGPEAKLSGIFSVSTRDPMEWDEHRRARIAALAAGGVIRVVNGGKTIQKFSLNAPSRFAGMPGLTCPNPDCMSQPANMQRGVTNRFLLSNATTSTPIYICGYCEWTGGILE